MADSPIVKPDIPDNGPTYDSYYTRYYFDFTSAPDDNGVCVDYRVNIAKRDLLIFPPTPIELQGGPSPFVLSLGNDSDPLAVTRTASAQISFFDDIDLSALLPSDATQWRVELVRVSDGKRIFWGYLTAEVYTQPAIEGPNVITINAASPLVPILAEELDTTDVGMVTIGRLIRNALYTIEGIDTVYMPAIYTTDYPTATSQYTDILRYTLSQAMYIHPSGTAAITRVQYESDSYAEPLEALCRLFGWSMVDVGDGSLYFVMAGYDGKYMQLTFDDLVAETAFTPILVEPAVARESDIEPIDTSDTIEMQQGVGSVMLEVKATDFKVNNPNAEDYIQIQNFTRRSATYSYYGVPDAKVEIAELNVEIRHPDITLHKYILSGSLAADGAVVKEWAETNDKLSADIAGAAFRKFQWADPDNLALNAENRLRSWSLQSAYYIKERAEAILPGMVSPPEIFGTIPNDLPLLTLRAGIGCFSDGALVINMNVLAVSNDGLFIPEDRYIQGGSLKMPTEYDDAPFGKQYFWGNYTASASYKGVICSLSVGNMFWTGTRWSDTPSTFIVSLSKSSDEWHPVISNKNVDMLYEDAEGMYIPINTALSGPIVLRVFRTTVVTSSGEDESYAGEWYVKDLTITHKPTIEHEIPSIADTTYYRSLGNNFTEKKDVTLDLHSRINGAEQLSLIYKDATTPLDTLYKVTHASARKPEQYLLDEYERVYGRALQRWRRGMMLRELRPIDIFSRATSSSVLAITGYTADFDANTIVAYLTDVKKINKIHNVE